MHIANRHKDFDFPRFPSFTVKPQSRLRHKIFCCTSQILKSVFLIPTLHLSSRLSVAYRKFPAFSSKLTLLPNTTLSPNISYSSNIPSTPKLHQRPKALTRRDFTSSLHVILLSIRSIARHLIVSIQTLNPTSPDPTSYYPQPQLSKSLVLFLSRPLHYLPFLLLHIALTRMKLVFEMR